MKIAELSGELRVLKSHCKAKTFTLETLAHQPFPQKQIQQPCTNPDGDLERHREEYERLSREIAEVTAKAKNDLELQEKEHERRNAKLTKKFATLLADNKVLQNKFRTLEQLYQDVRIEAEGVQGSGKERGNDKDCMDEEIEEK